MLSADQESALKIVSMWWQSLDRSLLFCLGGLAGTGKTTLIPHILDSLDLAPDSVCLCAPTGKAARVLARKLNFALPVRTIHSALYAPAQRPPRNLRFLAALKALYPNFPEVEALRLFKETPDSSHPYAQIRTDILETLKAEECKDSPIFSLNPTAPARSASLIIIDEASMVGGRLTADLLALNIPILAIGDPGQLPPIDSSGTPLFSLHPESSFILSQIHRQAEGSPILSLAYHVRNGNPIPPNIHSLDGSVEVRSFRSLSEALDPWEGLLPDGSARGIIVGKNKTRWMLTNQIRRTAGFHGLPHSDELIMCLENAFYENQPPLTNGSLLRLSEPASTVQFAPTSAYRPSSKGRPPGMPKPKLRLGMSENLKARGIEVPNLRTLSGTILDNEEETEIIGHTHGFRQTQEESNLDFPRTYSESGKVSGFPGADPVRGWFKTDFGWVLTCHKAQGSQYESVILIDESGVFREDRSRWLYTAITRASERLIVYV